MLGERLKKVISLSFHMTACDEPLLCQFFLIQQLPASYQVVHFPYTKIKQKAEK